MRACLASPSPRFCAVPPAGFYTAPAVSHPPVCCGRRLQLRALLRPGRGRLLLAVVLPFRPFVEDGAGRRPPAELLPLPPDASFEASLGAPP